MELDQNLYIFTVIQDECNCHVQIEIQYIFMPSKLEVT